MEPHFVPGDAERFLELLSFPGRTLREIRLIDPAGGGVRQRFCRTASEAVTVIAEQSGHTNIYVGACPRSMPRGTRDAVRSVTAAWADLDLHQIDPNRDVALELAYRRIEALGLAPTMLVHTGNGLQTWWLYKEPAGLSEAWPAERFEAINRGLAAHLGGDHVHDLARVLRVPGTMNLPTAKKRERGCVPVMARLLQVDGPTYQPGDFRSLAAPVSVGCANTPGRPPASEVPPDEVIAAFIQLLTELGSAHPVSRTWSGERAPRDPSRSGWDWALVRELQRIGMKEEFIPAVIRAFSNGRGCLATDRYIARTILKTQTYWRGSHESRQPLEA